MSRAYSRFLAFFNLCASVGLVLMMLLICADVFGRSMLNRPIVGVPEIVKVSIVAIFWMQVAYALHQGQHLRSNILFAAFPRTLKQVIWALNCIAGLTVFGLIFWYTIDDLQSTWRNGDFEGEHPMRVPVWPVWLILVSGAALTALEYARQFVASVRGTGLAVLDEGTMPADAAPTDARST